MIKTRMNLIHEQSSKVEKLNPCNNFCCLFYQDQYHSTELHAQVICDVIAGAWGKKLMPYPINQRAHQFNSIQSVPVSFGLWDTALKFLSQAPAMTSQITWALRIEHFLVMGFICVFALLDLSC